MKPVAEDLPNRLRRLVSAAGSQRRLADIIGVSAPTVIGWLSGSTPYESTYTKIAEATGVSIPWLRDGVGDSDDEVDAFKARLGFSGTNYSHPSSVLREEPPSAEHIGSAPADRMQSSPVGLERIIDHLATEMSTEQIAKVRDELLLDEAIPAKDARRVAVRLNAVIQRRAHERRRREN